MKPHSRFLNWRGRFSIVTVESDWGERSTQTGPRGAEQTARSLLLEILRRAKSRGALDVKVAAKKGVSQDAERPLFHLFGLCGGFIEP